jgi:hypothetical protein
MDPARIEQRLAALERQNLGLKLGMLAIVLVGVACGGITSRYERCISKTFVVDSPDEKTELSRVTASAAGGVVQVNDERGRPRVVIDADGIRVLDEGGKATWSSKTAK